MAVIDLDICNLALSHIGQGAITAEEYAGNLNESARHLNIIYDFSRDNLLRIKDWRFATVKEVLVASDDEVPNWTYIYDYPANCMHISKIFYDVESQDPGSIEFETVYVPVAGVVAAHKVIAANYDDAYIEYVYKVTDPDLFDVSFINAFSYFLAAQIAKPLTNDDKMPKIMMDIYYSLISDASRVNNSERFLKSKQTSSFEDSR